jgi:biotin carboxylase
LRDFLRRVPAPWVLKPRSLAGAVGIRKLWNSDEIWSMLDRLEGLQSHYLVERFVPGDVFHVDSIVHNGEIRFAIASGYGRPPMEIAHEGGIFTTRILERGSDLAAALLAENARVLRTMGLRSGASHTEFIRDAASGQLLFLETSARVGGAHIAEMVEAATGLNLWAEWARVEIAGEGGEYEPPADCRLFAGLLISLARQSHPNTSTYNDPEIVWRIDREHHVGFVIRSHNYNRVKELLGQYLQRVQADFQASLPPREAPAY